MEFQYRPWARALQEAKNGEVHGLMGAYWQEDRVEFLNYPDVVWEIKEEFIALQSNPITYTGALTDLKGVTIGVINRSVEADELQAAGVQIEVVTDPIQNIKKLLVGRIDAILISRDIFFYQVEQMEPQFDRTRVKILTPPYKVYEMYVVFSKKQPDYAQLTADFNRGLQLIKADGTYEKILQKHMIMFEE